MPRSDVRAPVERSPVVPGAPPAHPAPGAPLEPSLYLDPAIVDIEQRAIFEQPASWKVEPHDGWPWLEAPLGEKPSDNRVERLYARLVRPTPGLRAEDRRVWRYTAIEHPDQVDTWRLWPDGRDVMRDESGAFRFPGAPARSRAAQQRINKLLNATVIEEDVDLVDNVRRGIRTRGYRPGPPSRREAAVASFADRVGADLGGGGR